MKSKAKVLIEMMTEQLLVNNKVRDKQNPEKTGVIATIGEDGAVTVKWDDGTESPVDITTIEKMEEPVAPAPEPEPGADKLAPEPNTRSTPAPQVGAGGAMASSYKEGFRRLKDGRVQMLTEQWTSLPKGWTEDSVKSMWKSLTGDRAHKITACIKKVQNTGIDDPGAFCASLARRLGEK